MKKAISILAFVPFMTMAQELDHYYKVSEDSSPDYGETFFFEVAATGEKIFEMSNYSDSSGVQELLLELDRVYENTSFKHDWDYHTFFEDGRDKMAFYETALAPDGAVIIIGRRKLGPFDLYPCFFNIIYSKDTPK